MGFDPELRKALAFFILQARSKDREIEGRGAGWLSQSRSLREYCNQIGVMKSYIDCLLEEMVQRRGVLHLLDIGVGRGEVIGELHEKFKEKVFSMGVGLTFRKFQPPPQYTHRVGLIENLILSKKHFDFVFSVRGGFAYTLNSFSAVQEVLNSLQKDGVAFLQDHRLLLTQGWFRDYLNNVGFSVEVTLFREGLPSAFEILRKTDSSLDLTEMNRRYLKLVKSHRELFIEWGFDRLKNGSPLNVLFQELYSRGHYRDLIP